MQPQDLYARLELITPELKQANIAAQRQAARQRGLKFRLQQFGQALLKSFLGSREPQIATKYDREGRAYYVVYDPVDRQHYTFHSEQEVRIWLDGRYYQ